MKAMVLAAGKGTRLLPLTAEIPKPMAPIAGKPMLQHIFELLVGSDVEEVHVNAFHLAETILGCYGENALVEGMPGTSAVRRGLWGRPGGQAPG